MENPIIIKSSEKNSKIKAWSLVLDAMDIDYRVDEENNLWHIAVSEVKVENALKEIDLYERENPEKPTPFQVILHNLSIAYMLLIPTIFAIFFIIEKKTSDTIGWIPGGMASAEKICSGQWWRAITALTLHGDINHLMGNITFGGIIIFSLCRITGSGTGLLLTLISGTGGNLVNALYYETSHNSIGFSTSVFSALGILTGLQIFKRFRYGKKKIWLPFGAAFALLAILGSGNGDGLTDLGAHLFGFLFGIFSAIVYGLLDRVINRKNIISKGKNAIQWLYTGLFFLIIILSWVIAFYKR